MKTQIYGTCIAPPPSSLLEVLCFPMCHFLTEGSFSNWAMSKSDDARNNYRINRENGETQDNPSGKLKYDGTSVWEQLSNGDCYITYNEGPSDKAWMEEKDLNYVLRLEREGNLDELEPDLRIEVPELYEKIEEYRTKKAAKATAPAEVEVHIENDSFNSSYYPQLFFL